MGVSHAAINQTRLLPEFRTAIPTCASHNNQRSVSGEDQGLGFSELRCSSLPRSHPMNLPAVSNDSALPHLPMSLLLARVQATTTTNDQQLPKKKIRVSGFQGFRV
jgi:hypothetical protein